jgi:hypothetical protein
MPPEQVPAWRRAIPIALVFGVPIYFALLLLAGLPCSGHCGAGLASLPFRLIAYLPAQFTVHATLPALADAVLTAGGIASMIVTAYPVVVVWAIMQNWQDRLREQVNQTPTRRTKRDARRIKLG